MQCLVVVRPVHTVEYSRYCIQALIGICASTCVHLSSNAPSHSFGPFRALRSVLSINKMLRQDGKEAPEKEANIIRFLFDSPHPDCLDSDCCPRSHIAKSSPFRSSALARA